VVGTPATTDAELGATVTVVQQEEVAVRDAVIADVPDTAVVALLLPSPATPVTIPIELTVAATALLVDHVTVCPVIVLPL
jgi:hypothetical protein